MEKVLYINACIRQGDSRTLKIADVIIDELSKKYEIEEINLSLSKLQALNYNTINNRFNGIIDPLAIEYANKFKDADKIVISAPFWDMSFPSILKVFFENISLNDITFKTGADGNTIGNCKANDLMLITTRGMLIEDESPLDQASSYLKALGWLFGIPNYYIVSLNGADVLDQETVNKKIQQTINKGLEICKEF